MKLLLKIVLAIIIIFVLVAGAGMFYLSRGLDSGRKLNINSVNVSLINDGVYDGKYKEGRWSNEVNVTVTGHKITKIDIIKDVTFNRDEWTKELFNRVIEKQNTNVDVVSGATVTSKAYLKAIENALKR